MTRRELTKLANEHPGCVFLFAAYGLYTAYGDDATFLRGFLADCIIPPPPTEFTVHPDNLENAIQQILSRGRRVAILERVE